MRARLRPTVRAVQAATACCCGALGSNSTPGYWLCNSGAMLLAKLCACRPCAHSFSPAWARPEVPVSGIKRLNAQGTFHQLLQASSHTTAAPRAPHPRRQLTAAAAAQEGQPLCRLLQLAAHSLTCSQSSTHTAAMPATHHKAACEPWPACCLLLFGSGGCWGAPRLCPLECIMHVQPCTCMSSHACAHTKALQQHCQGPRTTVCKLGGWRGLTTGCLSTGLARACTQGNVRLTGSESEACAWPAAASFGRTMWAS